MKKFIAENPCLSICLGSLITALGGAIAVGSVEHQLTLKEILHDAFFMWGFCCTAFSVVYELNQKKSLSKAKRLSEGNPEKV